MSPLTPRRSTPGIPPIPIPGREGYERLPSIRAMRQTLVSLAVLVNQIMANDVDETTDVVDALDRGRVRDALRICTARVRDQAIDCRVWGDGLVLAGEIQRRAGMSAEPLLEWLLDRLVACNIGSLMVRSGASPGEIFTLATLLARYDRAPDLQGGGASQQELMRTWNVLLASQDPSDEEQQLKRRLTPASVVAELGAAIAEGAGASSIASGLSLLASAYSDQSANEAVDIILPGIAEAENRGDAQILEGVARSCMARIHIVGAAASRLALERLLRRLLRRRSLELIASRLPHTSDRLLLLEVMARGGEASVAVLKDLLLHAQDSAQRRVYFDSIVSLDMGAAIIVDLLRDHRWYVVRNALALLGEMGVSHADVAMFPLLEHEDARIRIAAARALTRLGTPRALAQLHTLIEDPSVEVRRLAAASYGSTMLVSGSVRPPAARLAMALEMESDQDVALEMLSSLGRLGTADAVQRLLRVALPPQQPQDGSERPAPRASYLRVAAIEALFRARGQAVLSTLEILRNDPDEEVVAALLRLSY